MKKNVLNEGLLLWSVTILFYPVSGWGIDFEANPPGGGLSETNVVEAPEGTADLDLGNDFYDLVYPPPGPRTLEQRLRSVRNRVEEHLPRLRKALWDTLDDVRNDPKGTFRLMVDRFKTEHLPALRDATERTWDEHLPGLLDRTGTLLREQLPRAGNFIMTRYSGLADATGNLFREQLPGARDRFRDDPMQMLRDMRADVRETMRAWQKVREDAAEQKKVLEALKAKLEPMAREVLTDPQAKALYNRYLEIRPPGGNAFNDYVIFGRLLRALRANVARGQDATVHLNMRPFGEEGTAFAYQYTITPTGSPGSGTNQVVMEQGRPPDPVVALVGNACTSELGMWQSLGQRARGFFRRSAE
jgi:hypothetical protein